jgi:hypothetical protein
VARPQSVQQGGELLRVVVVLDPPRQGRGQAREEEQQQEQSAKHGLKGRSGGSVGNGFEVVRDCEGP